MTWEFRELRLKRSHYTIMLDHVKDSLPSEACGILLGKAVEDVALVVEVTPTGNVSSFKDLFTVGPEELYQVLVHGGSQGLDMASIIHSHFVGPDPSNVDSTYMKLNSVVWSIFGFPSSGVIRVSVHQMIVTNSRR